jgi:NADH-quinone oxidoreductase subunit F
MGSASVIVMDETTDMVWAALKMIHFFRHESCGKCTPCREGTFWMEQVLHRVYHGHGTEADIKLLESIANNMTGKCLCALGEFATSPVLSASATSCRSTRPRSARRPSRRRGRACRWR